MCCFLCPDLPTSPSIFSQPTPIPPSRPNVFSALNLSQTDALLLLRPENIFLPFHSLPQMVDLHFYVSLPQTVGEDSPFHSCVLGSQCSIWHTNHKQALGEVEPHSVEGLPRVCPGKCLQPLQTSLPLLGCGNLSSSGSGVNVRIR